MEHSIRVAFGPDCLEPLKVRVCEKPERSSSEVFVRQLDAVSKILEFAHALGDPRLAYGFAGRIARDAVKGNIQIGLHRE